MRVFILCTGRCGSTTLIEACKEITNFSAEHESLVSAWGAERLNYADNHIEADNRLSWFLGQLDRRFGDEVFYVHLKKNRDEVAKSYANRFHQFNSIMDAYSAGIKWRKPAFMNEEQRLNICYDYVDTVTANIEFFLENKTNKMTFQFENRQDLFPEFWKRIGAEGDLLTAMKNLEIKHNARGRKIPLRLWMRFKIVAIGEWRRIKAIRAGKV